MVDTAPAPAPRRLLVAHTADLPAATLSSCADLLAACFDDLEDEDWEHCLGGLHAVVLDGPAVVAHAALVQRRLVHAGRALRCGYVEGVAVASSARRQGHATALMGALGDRLARAYDLGALGTTDAALPLYRRLGWQVWRGPLRALTPDGVVDCPDEAGAVLVLPGARPLDLDGELVADWRDGDVW